MLMDLRLAAEIGIVLNIYGQKKHQLSILYVGIAESRCYLRGQNKDHVVIVVEVGPKRRRPL